MLWNSRFFHKVAFLAWSVLLLCPIACKKAPMLKRSSGEAQKVIFASLGKDQYLVVFLSSFLEQLYGSDWYRQTIVVDHTHYFLGQPAPPRLLWKTDGLVFQVDKRGLAPDIKREPFSIFLFSLEKNTAYRIYLDCERGDIRSIWYCHTELGRSRVNPQGFLYGFRCKGDWKKTELLGGKVATDQSEREAID